MGQPFPTPIPLTPAAPANDFLGIPAYIWILVVGAIVLQAIKFIRLRRR
jgi:hypothetical protein